jgi:hypothetical protein
MLLHWNQDIDRNYMDRIPGITQVYTSVRIIGRCGLDMVKKRKTTASVRNQMHFIYPKSLTLLEYSLYQFELGRRNFWTES